MKDSRKDRPQGFLGHEGRAVTRQIQGRTPLQPSPPSARTAESVFDRRVVIIFRARTPTWPQGRASDLTRLFPLIDGLQRHLVVRWFFFRCGSTLVFFARRRGFFPRHLNPGVGDSPSGTAVSSHPGSALDFSSSFWSQTCIG